MTEFGGKLLDDISKAFGEKVQKDRTLKVISNRVRDGTDYGIADRYSVRVGELLSEAILENTKTLAYMSEEVAREVLTPLLTVDHDMIAEAAKMVQENMNAAQGLGIGIQVPELDTNRIAGFIAKVSSYDNYDDARWVLEDPIVNYSQSVVDQAMRKNMRQADSLGMRPKIRRTVAPYEVREKTIRRKLASGTKEYKALYVVPCKWCADLAGTYDYAEVKATGSDVFRRHEKCRCEVTYINNGKYQDVWSKTEWSTDDAQARAAAIAANEQRLAAEAKIREQNRIERMSVVDFLVMELGYSPKGAAITYNQNRHLIAKRGVDWFVEYTRQTNPYARRARQRN